MSQLFKIMDITVSVIYQTLHNHFKINFNREIKYLRQIRQIPYIVNTLQIPELTQMKYKSCVPNTSNKMHEVRIVTARVKQEEEADRRIMIIE